MQRGKNQETTLKWSYDPGETLNMSISYLSPERECHLQTLNYGYMILTCMVTIPLMLQRLLIQEATYP